MSQKQTKAYGVYYWDTFDNETFILQEFDDSQVAISYVEKRFAGRLRPSGADKIDLVDLKGNIVKQWSVG